MNFKKLMAAALCSVLVIGSAPATAYTTVTIETEAATKGYTISLSAGSYTGTQTVKITAKKGYKVYYTTGSDLSVKKVIKSGKSKTLTLSKTTTLKVYAVKTSTTVTAKKLRSTAVKKKIKSYKYKINSAVTTDSDSVITLNGTSVDVGSSITDSVSTDSAGSASVVTIKRAGSYTITGSAKNTQIAVAKDISGEVTLILSDLTIDNSGLGTSADEENPVIEIKKGTTAVNLVFSGTCKLTGNGSVTSEAPNIIAAKDSSAKLTISAADSSSKLTIIDPLAAESEDGAAGIKSKGDLTITSGTYSITTAGDGINASDGTVSITGGTFSITSYSDGIQGEVVNITGSPKIDITTKYKYSSTNFYDSSRGEGNYNTLTENEQTSTKTEVFYVDTGSHKGIKGGTKEETINYKDGTASASTTASGGINISGGTITIDTTATGTKSENSIIGDPEDGIHSNNTLSISGGNITVSSADDGITAANDLTISGSSTKVNIKTSYEGLEAGVLTIGSTKSDKPTINIIASDDGINASAKTVTTTYDTVDEKSGTEVKVTKTGNKFILNGGTVTIDASADGVDCNGSFIANGGSITVYGAANGGNAPIDYDDSFENNGAEILALGMVGMTQAPTSGSQAYVEFGTTSRSGSMFGGTNPPDGTTGGNGGMTPPDGTTGGNGGMTPPDGTTGGNSGMTPPGGGNGNFTPPTGTGDGQLPGGPGGSTSTLSTIAAGTQISVLDASGNTLASVTTKRSVDYVFYSAPGLSSGQTYTLSASGTTTTAQASSVQ